MMGRNRTPTSVLEARGAFLNHPGRKLERMNEPILNGEIRDTAPVSMSTDEKKI